MVKKPLTADDFWDTIERAWSAVPAAEPVRAGLVTDPAHSSTPTFHSATELDKHLDAMLAAVRTILMTFNSAELAAWDAHMERALWDIDREDVHEVLDGSDDGFLYARGFVVAAGRKYYEAVSKDPETYGVDAECEEITYFAAHLHEKRFGEWPEHKSGISRESCTNPEGWK